MARRTKGIESTTAVFLVIVVIIIAAVVFYLSTGKTVQTTTAQTGASLNIQGFNSPYLYFNRSSTITTVVSNNGDSPANDVTLSLMSDALPSSLISKPQSIEPGSSTTFAFNTTSKDTRNGVYALAIAASYSDIRGQTRVNFAAQQLTVMPTVKTTDIGWLCPFPCLFPKQTIGRTDSTEWHFEVQSLSLLAQYSGLTAQITFLGDHAGLNVSPDSIAVAIIGPNGPSAEYKFTIQSQGAPIGDYKFTLTISYLGTTVASYADTVKVR